MFDRPNTNYSHLNCPRTIQLGINAVGKRNSPNSAIFREDLVAAIRSTHEEIGYLPPWLPTRDFDSRADLVTILLSHQPNFLPYLGATAQFALVSRIATELVSSQHRDILPLHVVIDTDVSSDSRFRSALFPQPSAKGGLLHLPIISRAESSSLQLMHLCNRPAWNTMESVFAKMRQALRELHPKSSNEWKLISEKHFAFEQRAKHIWTNAGNLSVLNTSILSYWIHDQWDLEIPFVFASKLYPLMRNSLGWVVTPLLENVRDLGDLFWRVCSCKSRIPFTRDDTKCPACGVQHNKIDSLQQIENEFGINFLPKVKIDNIFDVTHLKKSIGVMYPGGASHASESNNLLTRINISAPPTLVWRPCGAMFPESKLSLFRRDDQEAIVSLVNNGRVSHAFYVANFDPKLFLQSIRLALKPDVPYNSQVIHPN